MPGRVRAAREEELAGIHAKRPKRSKESNARETKAGGISRRRSGRQGFKAIPSLSRFLRLCCEMHPGC